MNKQPSLGHKVSTVCITMDEAFQSPTEGNTIIARAKAGDSEAFEELYREHVGRVYALCLRMTRNKTVSEDLCQEAFLRAWRKIKSFREESAFSTWLHRLTVNLVLTHLRTDSRHTEKVFTTDNLSPFEKPTRNKPAGMRADLESAIATLPERARAIFILHDVEGYRHREIADMLGIATGTTKAQLHRARRMLREVLA